VSTLPFFLLLFPCPSLPTLCPFLLLPSAIHTLPKIPSNLTIPGDESSAADPYISAAVAQGVPVVISTKINVGCVVPSAGSDSIAAGFLNPVKARIQLQYALANGYGMNATRASFEQVLGSMIGYGASG